MVGLRVTEIYSPLAMSLREARSCAAGRFRSDYTGIGVLALWPGTGTI
ncbi:MAG: hypothetical protein ACI9CF_000715 [Candidatus Omnitrophota bacterium]|jgi:hypothetical protein